MWQIISKVGSRTILKNKKFCRDGFQIFFLLRSKIQTRHIYSNVYIFNGLLLVFFSSLYFSFRGRIRWPLSRTGKSLRFRASQSWDRERHGSGNGWMHLVLSPLLQTRYENISHGFITALSERWHAETRNIHMPVGDMTSH